MKKPFKLKGHELPGPNQRDPSPAKLEMPWDDSSALETQEPNVTDIKPGSELRGNLRNRMQQMMEVRRGERKGVGKASQFIKDGGEDVGSAQVYTPPTDIGTDIGAGIGTELSDDTSTTKKNVDVEVTVNGQKI